jgi:hypothetical protein
VRIVRDVSLPGYLTIKWTAGAVAEMPTYIAETWIKQGMAMEDKTVDVSETKALQPALQFKSEALQNKRDKTLARVKRYRDKQKGIVK